MRSYSLDTIWTLEQFLASIEQRAYRMALLATGNRDDALDVVQDAMTKLVQKYAHKHADEWGPLFHRILQTTIRDGYRRSKIRNGLRHLFFGEEDENPIESLPENREPEPDRVLSSTQDIEAVDRALRTLSLRQQQVFLLRAWEGLDVKQTAKAMSCSEGSVKTHYSRAVHSLRQQLEDFES